jgi:peptidoglycan L-alanyl-D-glutamate endopeptidase CwlK
MDAVTLGRIEHLHPQLRDEVRAIYIEEIVPALSGRATCRFAYTLRTFKEQDELYAKGRTVLFDSFGNRIGKVTNAKGGQSYHNYGLALDICLIVDKRHASWDYKKDFDGDKVSDWMEVVKIFKAHGWAWGGDWKFIDRPHFEKTFGLSNKELLRRYNAKDFIPGTEYVRL